MTTAFIGLGSNLSPRLDNCKKALSLLSGIDKIKLKKVSSAYESIPEFPALNDDPKFVNMIAKIDTKLRANDLLNSLEKIEKEMGRVIKGKGFPRVIDLDLLLYNSELIDEDKLKVPHPRMSERLFVLKPFAEIAPDVKHPIYNKTIKELLIDKLKGENDENIHRLS